MRGEAARELTSEEASHGHVEEEKRNAGDKEAKCAKSEEKLSKTSLSSLLPTSLSLPWFGGSHANQLAEHAADHNPSKRACGEGVKSVSGAATAEVKSVLQAKSTSSDENAGEGEDADRRRERADTKIV